TIKADDTIQLTVPVTNSGERDGTEIVQVYVSKVDDVDGPLKTLKGFKRVDVKAGQTQKVTIALPPSSFKFYNWDQRKMAVTTFPYPPM
ncbi:MAG: fibronectin type III-like domain-contianing protein, partial [Anaerolineae bacterium]